MPLPSGPSFLVGGNPALPWKSAGEVLNDAALEVGLAAQTDPFAATDAAFVRLVAYLKSLGRELVRRHTWSHLRVLYTLPTVADQSTYPLPADFGVLIPQTSWNRTQTTPMLGPLSAQSWSAVLGIGTAAVGVNLHFRPFQAQLQIAGTSIPGAESLSFEYVSKWWVQTATDDVPSTDVPSAAGDILWLDPSLLVRGLKLEWKKGEGFDTSAVQQDFDATLSQIIGQDSPGQVLSLYANREPRFLDERNIPPLVGLS